MPVQYRSIVEEHLAVRRGVGLFDISHMGRLTFEGPGVPVWLESLTTNQVSRLAEGQIQYSLVTNERGGVIDDILVYRQTFAYLVVCNAANRGRVAKHFRLNQDIAQASLLDRTLDTAMIAVQGPRAIDALQPLFDQPLRELRYYHSTMGRLLERVDTVSAAPATPARTASRSSWRRRQPRRSGRRCWSPAGVTGSCPAVWAPAIRFAWRPPCRSMATS